MRKLISIAASAAVALGTCLGFSIPALQNDTSFICDIPGCRTEAEHSHSVCPLVECTFTVNHEHNRTLYFAHHADDGHSYHQPVLNTPEAVKKEQPESTPVPETSKVKSTVKSEALNATALTVCDFEDCAITVRHEHDGIAYDGHHSKDGHDHAVCSVSGCTKTGTHTHNGKIYGGHHSGDGHNHAVCSVSGCTKTGTHTHNGKIYGGHHNNDGHGHNSKYSGNHKGGGHH